MTSDRYSSKNSARISSCLLVALGLSLASAEPLGTSLGLPVLEELSAPLQVQPPFAE
jgi:hypothetical protein